MTTEIKEKETTKEAAPKTTISKNKAKAEDTRKKDLKMVRGMFKNHEVVGGNLKFSFRKYENPGVQHFDFNDGEIYTIPYMVAKHINQNSAYVVHEYYSNSDNKVQMRAGSKIQRFSFVPLDFNDDEGLSVSNIVTVERV